MTSLPRHSGDLSQDLPTGTAHQNDVPALTKSVVAPAAVKTRAAYRNLSSASVGLEFGIAVIVGLLFGMWLDRQAGTTPWLMLVFMGFGFTAGFRGVLRAVKREDKAAGNEAARG